MADRLYRSRDDRMIAGVSGGLAASMDADPSIIRVAWVIVTVLTGGIALLVYIVMAIVVPEEPAGYVRPAPATPTGPMPEGGWVAPDGSIVPNAGTPAPGSDGALGIAAGGSTAAKKDPTDTRRIAILGGLLLVALGAIFLARELLPAIDISAVWPIASIAFGILLIVLSVRRRRH